jgi:hypothetical protein
MSPGPLVVEPTERNAARLGRVLHAFGFPALAAQAARFAEVEAPRRRRRT